ncbi:MAG: M24 family metallopeptidase [Planctomycetota bacterium]|nr:M24 family metallopeptidase [Planctomycetota bacterium]
MTLRARIPARVLLAALLLGPATLAAPRTAPPGHGPAARRTRLAAALGDGYALVFGQPITDTVRLRPHGHMMYLLGLREPGSALLLAGKRAPRLPRGRAIAFLADGRPSFVRFHGFSVRPGATTAQRLGIDAALASSDTKPTLVDLLARWLPRKTTLLVPGYRGPDEGAIRWHAETVVRRLRGARPDLRVTALDGHLGALRAIKEPGELRAIEQAISKTVLMFEAARTHIRAGGREEHVDAALAAAVRRARSRAAFPFIVAAGAHSLTPHYFENRGPLRAGDMLIVDAAATHGGYACDVTRTFPVSGKFRPRQRAVYKVLLDAHRAALDAVRPGARFKDLRTAALGVLRKHGFADGWLHAVGHHVGLDVHDPGPTRLASGMVIAVEPGVYLRQDGFGLRIEDVVAVTDDGYRLLTAALPRDPDAIERWLAR